MPSIWILSISTRIHFPPPQSFHFNVGSLFAPMSRPTLFDCLLLSWEQAGEQSIRFQQLQRNSIILLAAARETLEKPRCGCQRPGCAIEEVFSTPQPAAGSWSPLRSSSGCCSLDSHLAIILARLLLLNGPSSSGVLIRLHPFINWIRFRSMHGYLCPLGTLSGSDMQTLSQ